MSSEIIYNVNELILKLFEPFQSKLLLYILINYNLINYNLYTLVMS